MADKKKSSKTTKSSKTKTSKGKDSSLEKQLKKLNENIATQNFYNTRGQIIIRGLINGLFTALGATIGLTIVLFLLASFLRTVSAVPFINDILEQTGINRIIEYQIQQIEEDGPTSLPETGEEAGDTVKPEGEKTPTPTTEKTPEPTTRFELTDEYY